MGLGSSRHSAPQVILCNSSSLASPFPKMFLRALMAPLIIRSNTPLKLGAVGGLNFHSIKGCLLVSLTTRLSRLSASCQNSLSAPTKFVLLWESVTWHPPPWHYLLKGLMKESMLSSKGHFEVPNCGCMTSKQAQISLVFRFARPCFIKYSQPKWTLIRLNALKELVTLHFGRGAIILSKDLALNHWWSLR